MEPARQKAPDGLQAFASKFQDKQVLKQVVNNRCQPLGQNSLTYLCAHVVSRLLFETGRASKQLERYKTRNKCDVI